MAQSHTKVMVDQDCFDHVCSGEGSLTKRLQDSGYLHGPKWAYAENLGYDHTPRKGVNRWMDSDPHRRIILKGKWEDLGIGVANGTPDPDKPDSQFVTYTTIFGVVG